MKKKTFDKKLSLNRETLRRLSGGLRQEALAGLPTTPIGTCPASDPAACGGGTGGTSTVECTQ
jgi:hypothetical protein